MPTIAEALQIAVQHHQAGRLSEAEQIYRQILEIDANQFDACNNLGALAYQTGRTEIAIEFIQRAIALQPNNGLVHFNLGVAWKALGKTHEALACYRRALACKPDYAEALNNLCAMLLAEGEHHEAMHYCRQALTHNPQCCEAYYNLGIIYKSQEEWTDAINCFQQVLACQTNHLAACQQLGLVLLKQERAGEAIPHLLHALQLQPENCENQFYLGEAYFDVGRFDDAVFSYRQALSRKPDFFEAQCNLAVTLHHQGRFQEAVAGYQQAIATMPEDIEQHNNYSKALLMLGDFDQGWREYEWRLRVERLQEEIPCYSQPIWNGELLAGKTLLLQAEQGLGDTLQFIRYAANFKQLGCRLLLRCQSPLVPLLRLKTELDQVFSEPEPRLHFDYYLPLMSSPHRFHPTLNTLPTETPYLAADPKLLAVWQRRLAPFGGFRVGINWHGREKQGPWLERDLPLEPFAANTCVPGVQCLSLQKGTVNAAELALLQKFQVVQFDDLDTATGSFMDTAAIMKNIDLVITSDTSIAHLAGALGVPVWVALPYRACWRWLLERSDSPWYPTMRLFRQTKRGEWNDVFERMRLTLQELIKPVAK